MLRSTPLKRFDLPEAGTTVFARPQVTAPSTASTVKVAYTEHQFPDDIAKKSPCSEHERQGRASQGDLTFVLVRRARRVLEWLRRGVREFLCPPRWRLKKAAPNPEAAKTHSLRVRSTKPQARHLLGPSREEASGFTIATPGLAALMASPELLHHILFQFLAARLSRFASPLCAGGVPPMT